MSDPLLAHPNNLPKANVSLANSRILYLTLPVFPLIGLCDLKGDGLPARRHGVCGRRVGLNIDSLAEESAGEIAHI